MRENKQKNYNKKKNGKYNRTAGGRIFSQLKLISSALY